MDPTGTRVGNFRIIEPLGEGGMGEVYVGFDETLHREVALKSIRPERRLDDQARARFLREARALSKLDHPGICRIYAYVQDETRDYLALELIRGRTLATIEGLDAGTRMRIAEAIAEVLVVTHAEGLVHRDLKPSNVMITDAGEVKVLDFGLARDLGPGIEAPRPRPEPVSPVPAADPAADTLDATLEIRIEEMDTDAFETITHAAAPEAPTRADGASSDTGGVGDTLSHPGHALTAAGAVMGTPFYMSPEQARGEPAGTASDLYSYGLLLQYLATGRHPHPPDLDRKAIVRRALEAKSETVTGVDRHVAELINRLKSAAPAARPTAVEVAERLRWIREKPARRIRRIGIAAMIAVALFAGVKYTVDVRRERAAALAAEQEAKSRRDQAEGLIGFMLGDLRDKLEEVGRLDILEDVGGRALEYFEAVPAEDLSDEELSRRSQALNQIGEVRMDQGDLDGALRAFSHAQDYAAALDDRAGSTGRTPEAMLRQADALDRIGQVRLAEGKLAVARSAFEGSLDLAERLTAIDTENTAWLARLGASHFWVGWVHFQQADLDSALIRFNEYLAASERMVELEPDVADWTLELLYAHSNLGSVYQAKGDRDAALEEFRLVLGLNRALVAANPDDSNLRFEMAITHNTVGVLLEELGKFAESASHFQNELELKQGLVDHDPENLTWSHNLARAHFFAGRLDRMRGRAEEATRHFSRHRRIAERLYQTNPDHVDWRRERAMARRWLAELAIDSGAVSIIPELEEVRDDFAELASLDPENADWRHQVAATEVALSRAHLTLGNRKAASEIAARASTVLDSLVAAAPGQRRTRQASLHAKLLLGLARAELGRTDEANALWRSVIETTGSDEPPGILDLRARALVLLGRDDEATTIVGTLLEAGYREPDFLRITGLIGPGTDSKDR